MKALSVIQPWASLIVHGAKRFETRSWQTSHRGPLLVHSSKKLPAASRELCRLEPFKGCLAKAGYAEPDQLPIGVILGAARVDDCIAMHDLADAELTGQERAFGDFRLGRWAWRLSKPTLLVIPIPYRGCLALFDVPDELLPPEIVHALL
jgi:hypothetical protein